MTLVDRIQALLDELVTTGAEVGAGVSVVRDGAVVADVSVGTRTDAGDPWQPDTLGAQLSCVTFSRTARSRAARRNPRGGRNRS